jgi:uncharacterized membrane protein
MRLAITIAVAAIAVIALVVLVIALIGSRLPKHHTVSRSVVLHKSPAEVYAVARDFESMPKWRSDVRAVTISSTPDGLVHFREDGKHGSVNYELVEDVPSQRMVTRILDTDLGYSGKWTYEFVPEGAGTRLKITENGEVSNVIFRFLSKYAFGHTATMDTHLKSLARHVGENEEVN